MPQPVEFFIGGTSVGATNQVPVSNPAFTTLTGLDAIHITGDTQITSGPGFLKSVIINNITANGSFDLLDGSMSAWNQSADIWSSEISQTSVTTATDFPIAIDYSVNFQNFLQLNFEDSLAADITISYREV